MKRLLIVIVCMFYVLVFADPKSSSMIDNYTKNWSGLTTLRYNLTAADVDTVVFPTNQIGWLKIGVRGADVGIKFHINTTDWCLLDSVTKWFHFDGIVNEDTLFIQGTGTGKVMVIYPTF